MREGQSDHPRSELQLSNDLRGESYEKAGGQEAARDEGCQLGLTTSASWSLRIDGQNVRGDMDIGQVTLRPFLRRGLNGMLEREGDDYSPEDRCRRLFQR